VEWFISSLNLSSYFFLSFIHFLPSSPSLILFPLYHVSIQIQLFATFLPILYPSHTSASFLPYIFPIHSTSLSHDPSQSYFLPYPSFYFTASRNTTLSKTSYCSSNLIKLLPLFATQNKIHHTELHCKSICLYMPYFFLK
jgi:hypothetical protein